MKICYRDSTCAARARVPFAELAIDMPFQLIDDDGEPMQHILYRTEHDEERFNAVDLANGCLLWIGSDTIVIPRPDARVSLIR